MNIHNYDNFLIATIDATIAATMCANAAIDLGLGTCFIGGVRMFPNEIKQMLNLENMCVPVLALTIGYESKKVAFRPKVNKVYEEKYDLEQVINELSNYDQTMHEYYENYFNLDTNFTKTVAQSMKKLNHNNFDEFVNQAFGIKK